MPSSVTTKASPALSAGCTATRTSNAPVFVCMVPCSAGNKIASCEYPVSSSCGAACSCAGGCVVSITFGGGSVTSVEPGVGCPENSGTPPFPVDS